MQLNEESVDTLVRYFCIEMVPSMVESLLGMCATANANPLPLARALDR